MKKKTNKYTSGEIQNEFLEIMALHVLRQICSDIAKTAFFTIMADECTDVSNKEQFMICIRWVDNTLTAHEDVIGLYNVGTIDACSLFSTIEDVLLRMNLTVSQCRGQCYDGASNMFTTSVSAQTLILQCCHEREELLSVLKLVLETDHTGLLLKTTTVKLTLRF
ncbi:hypothetical protein EMCRGX_G017549 [Ephydatia muelleri]